MRISTILLAAALATGTSFAARAGVGITTLPGSKGEGAMTVFYPTAEPDRPVNYGPFTLQVAPEAPPVRGNGRLVVVSHGTGGNAWVHADLARALVAAGFSVAIPLHRADNTFDHSDPGPASWKRRPAELSRAIDAVAQTPRLASQLQLDRVGVYGMSAGGLTALTHAGARWSPAAFVRHCEAHIDDDFPFCVGLATSLQGNLLDPLKKKAALLVIRHRFADPAWQTHRDPDVILEACSPRCTLLAHLPDAGHGALLSPQPPMARLGPIARDLLGEPPGFDRKQLSAVDGAITGFFQNHLLP